MGERLRPADQKTVDIAVSSMEGSILGLNGLVGQLKASIDASKRLGEAGPPVSILPGLQVAGKRILREFQGALDSLTVTVRDCDVGCGPDVGSLTSQAPVNGEDLRPVTPVLGSEVQLEIMGGGHA